MPWWAGYPACWVAEIVEFPRRLEWQEVSHWVGLVPGTILRAEVQRVLGATHFQWGAWNGVSLVAAGTATSLEEGKELARRALEDGVLVIRT